MPNSNNSHLDGLIRSFSNSPAPRSSRTPIREMEEWESRQEPPEWRDPHARSTMRKISIIVGVVVAAALALLFISGG